MRISELADLADVSIRSLRYYEQKGLIKPRRLENGYRDYDQFAIEQVRRIQLSLDLGLNTDEIGRIINCDGLRAQRSEQDACTAGLIKLYERKLQLIDNELQLLSEIKARLVGKIRHLQEEEQV
jgi:MerR family Zn(II)-responsive transcriptional regulator of zntA